MLVFCSSIKLCWTEPVLVVLVVFAVIVGWDLDGGLYGRFMDH